MSATSISKTSPSLCMMASRPSSFRRWMRPCSSFHFASTTARRPYCPRRSARTMTVSGSYSTLACLRRWTTVALLSGCLTFGIAHLNRRKGGGVGRTYPFPRRAARHAGGRVQPLVHDDRCRVVRDRLHHVLQRDPRRDRDGRRRAATHVLEAQEPLNHGPGLKRREREHDDRTSRQRRVQNHVLGD